MAGWQRLRTRLVITYVLLALVLLALADMLFSKALSSYAAQVETNQRTLAFEKINPKATAGTGQDMSAEAVKQRLQELLPGWQVTVVAEEISKIGIPVEKLGYILQDGVPVPDAKLQQSPLPGLLKLLMSRSETSAGEIIMAVEGTGKSAMALRITVRPSGTTILRTVLSQVLTILALALLLAVVLGWWFSRWVTRPLARLSTATAAVASGDFLQTVAPVGIEELDELAAQFNTMVVRLRDSFRSLGADRDVARRFAADAAHELRTPVTAMRTYQEVWAEHPDRAAQMLPAIGRQVERLERVISGLLQLATLTEGAPIALAPADLGAAVGALGPGLEAMALEWGHRLTVTLPGAPLTVRLDRRLLEQILCNLVDNACKYTPPGGRIEVVVAADPNGAVLSVRDSGPGVSPAEVPHLFQRFYRGIETQATPGTGLGLAIVEEAVARLGGTVGVETAPGLGTCFRVLIPAGDG